MGDVTWSERVVGDGTTRLTLKAAARDEYAFSGWSAVGAGAVEWPADYRYPGTLSVTVSTSAVVTASFIAKADDSLEFDLSELFSNEIACGEKVSVPFEIDSTSFPTLSFAGLPTGLSFKEQTLTLSGTATKPGVYRVTATAGNASGFTYQDFFTIRIGNISGEHVSGENVEIPLGEYYVAEFAESEYGSSKIFNCSAGWKKVDISGLPAGLSWDGKSDWEVVSGTPTKLGDYVVTAQVTFSNETHETATLIMSVVAPDPSEYDVDLDALDEIRLGDEFDYESAEIGEYDISDGLGVVSVSGLPKGLKAKTWTDKGVKHWGLDGVVEKPGRYDVTVKVSVSDGDGKKTVETHRAVIVRDLPDVYLSARTMDAAKGTVTGGGAVSSIDDAIVTAKPATGYVFAGWYDEDGEIAVFDDAVDYRESPLTIAAGTDFSMLTLLASFVSRAEDVAPYFDGLDGDEYELAASESFSQQFKVESLSLPTLTFKGLPKGFSCQPTGEGAFVLAYDGSTVAAKPSPGRYSVTVTAANRSGRKTTASFLVTVKNESSSRIHVEEDYGEFVPGEEISAIDLSQAVDFDNGETLKVSGLPKGLKYNAKDDERKGVEAHTITGTPTKPGEYTLTFTAKVVSSASTNSAGKVTYKYETAKATSFLTVLPYPELVLEVDEDALAAGNKVTGAGNYKSGTKVTLKATAAKGWVFAGWEGLDDFGTLDALSPKVTFVTGDDDALVYADFIEVRDDCLSIGEPELTAAGYALELPLGEDVDDTQAASFIADIIDTGSYPTVKVSNLPKGLKFSSSTFMLTGRPTRSGVYHVTLTVKNAGGYSFVRVLDIAVLEEDGAVPEEEDLPNDAGVDFSPLTGLTTGVHCATGAAVLVVGYNPETGAPVRKVTLSGLPDGLEASVTIDGGVARVDVSGTPTEPGRQIVTIKAAYESGSGATSKAAVVVQDGGSSYLDVLSLDEDGGTVGGSGVYAAGATVKVSAKAASKHVFSGWKVNGEPFADLMEFEDVDYRTTSVAFVFRPAAFAGGNALYGEFTPSADDGAVAISFESAMWSIKPEESSRFNFAMESKSLPKATVKGIPKGVDVDWAQGCFLYEPTASISPGIYTVTVSAKNTTVKKSTNEVFEIRVANRTSGVIGGLDPDMDAYVVSMGTVLDPELIVPEVQDGWSLSVKGLPSGVAYKDGVIAGVPKKAGDYTVTFTATTGKGSQKQTEVATITLRVAELPTAATGTFNGFLVENDSVVGTLKLTATAAGKVSLTMNLIDGKHSFSAKSWDSSDDERMQLAMADDDDEVSVVVDTQAFWQDWSLSGECRLDGVDYRITGQRNPYDKKGGVEEAKEQIELMAGKTSFGGWKAEISKKGVVKVSGKYDGQSVSGSCTMFYDGGYMSRLVKYIDKTEILNVVMTFDYTGEMTSCQTEVK